jgi:hypothetical protein
MHALNSPVAITGWEAAACQAAEVYCENRNNGAFITTCYYHKSMVYYSRTMANPRGRDMLFSSGDFPRTLSSILSGEGFDEREQGKSPLAILDVTPTFAPPARPYGLHHFKPGINSKTFEK